MEGYSNAGALNTGNSAPAGGRRSRRHHKLRMVKKKTVRKMLARQGLKMRGGAEPDTVDEVLGPSPSAGGRRRRSHKRSHRRSRGRSLFGLRY